MGIDTVTLSRLQFGFTIVFHIIFPAFTIGVSAFIATLMGRWLWTKNERFYLLARFWTKIFAVSFAMGVVSGLVLSYQFGTNWSRFSLIVGNVISPLLGYEVLTAFFLEATFLGILLFGQNRVPPWMHFLAAVMVAFGTAVSAFWILSANSWMQYPTGFVMKDGIAYPTDWLAIIFNPTFPLRFLHMVVAAYLTTAIVILAIGARWTLEGRFPDHSRTMLRMGLGLALVLAPAQLLIGDQHGLKTAEYQPAKLAAMEGHWDGSQVAPLELFAWPDQAKGRNDFEIGIPHLGSLIITHDWNGKFKGLDDFAPQDRPPVAPVFFAFRIMVAIGLALIGLAFWGGILWWRGRLETSRLYLKLASFAWPAGFLAIISGWITTEVGRQPWIATGVIRTSAAVSPVDPQRVLVSLILFVLVYGVVFSTGIVYINRLIRRGPAPETTGEEPGVPSRPLSGAERAAQHATHAVSGGITP